MKNKFEEPLPDKVPNNSEDDINKKFGVKFGVKFGIKFGVNDKQLLLLLNKTPGITAQELAEQFGKTKRAIEKKLKKLKDAGVISRQGSDKAGYWVMN